MNSEQIFVASSIWLQLHVMQTLKTHWRRFIWGCILLMVEWEPAAGYVALP